MAARERGDRAGIDEEVPKNKEEVDGVRRRMTEGEGLRARGKTEKKNAPKLPGGTHQDFETVGNRLVGRNGQRGHRSSTQEWSSYAIPVNEGTSCKERHW